MAEPGPVKLVFTCLPKLPAELRPRVWKYTCCVTRNVDIWVNPIYINIHEDGGSRSRPYQFVSKCPPPAVLHVCKESRTEGLKHYTLDFSSTIEITAFNLALFTVSSAPRIYFNWNRLLNPEYFDEYQYSTIAIET